MKNLNLIVFISFAMLTNLLAQQNISDEIKKRLNDLSGLGVQHKFLDENTIELTNTITGTKSIKTLKEPDAEAIYNWANQRDIPVLEIDPTQVDTTKWTGWYNYWTYLRVGNSEKIPTQVRDFDGNGFPEVYGTFGWIVEPENRIYEVYPDGTSIERYRYILPEANYSTHILDIDGNGLWEIVFQSAGINYFYEQVTLDTLPTQLKFVFNKYNGLAPYLSIERMAYMDNDTLIDFVHRGADTSITQLYLFYVSEYNPIIQNFEKKWYIEKNEYDGFDVGDYDGDNLMEILISSLWGKVMVIENTGDDMYEATFQDTLPLVNLFQQTSGDIDGDRKIEFFVGATMGSGNWTTMFESDGDNNFTPRFIFHLFSGGSLDDPTYITDDIDGDGKLELAILSGGYLYIFKSDGDDSYYLWYLKQGSGSFSINFYDMNGDSTKDILWTVVKDNQWGSNIYKGSIIDDVEDDPPPLPYELELLQNYPNPFNPSTNIIYKIDSYSYVTLKVFDLLGREVETIISEPKVPGEYKVFWDATGFPSGIYMYRLQTEKQSISRKMLLIK